MATLGEVERALATLREANAGPVALLHCVSIYPTPPADVHLRTMATWRDAFDVPVGFSDHTIGAAVPLAAVALGACIIEKHFTTDKALEGWDHADLGRPSGDARRGGGKPRGVRGLGQGRADAERRRAQEARGVPPPHGRAAADAEG